MSEYKAGRELDQLVAQKVMGIVWDETRCRVCGWPLDEESKAGYRKGNCSLRPYPETRADAPAHYSSDIAAAWQVVERMQSHGISLDIHPYTAIPGQGFRVAVVTPSLEEIAYETADTAPLAISLAALAAVGVEVAR